MVLRGTWLHHHRCQCACVHPPGTRYVWGGEGGGVRVERVHPPGTRYVWGGEGGGVRVERVHPPGTRMYGEERGEV